MLYNSTYFVSNNNDLKFITFHEVTQYITSPLRVPGHEPESTKKKHAKFSNQECYDGEIVTNEGQH
jgi:hypothetical protein